jgi:hypothetical protein
LVRYFAIQKRILGRLQAPANPFQNEISKGGALLREFIENVKPTYLPDLDRVSAQERQRLTWKLVERLLEASRDECARRGSTLMIVYRGKWPLIEEPVAGPPKPVPPKSEDPYCLGVRLQEMGEEQLEPIVKRLGIPYLDLTDVLRKRVAETGKSHIFPDDGHYNAMAHETAGVAMAEWIESYWASRTSQQR